MILKEFEKLLAKIKAENENAEEMEIGPIFNNDGEVILYIQTVRIINDNEIGIEWSC